MAKAVVYLEGRRNGYGPDQCPRTMTVGELIQFLQDFDEDALLYIKNDNGYTYGNISEGSFEEDWLEDEDEE